MDATFFIGKENSVLMTLTNNSVPVLPADITKVEFKYKTWSANSTDDPELFEFEVSGIRLKFGASDLVKGRYLMTVIVYSIDHPAGIVWETNADIRILQV